MKNEIFSNISKILERDSKSTTYKYALLRGVIDIIQDQSPYINISNGRVNFPLGLLIEKWMIYYYPIFESEENIPQIHGETQLAFAVPYKKFISAYAPIGGLSAFYNDLKNKGIPKHLQPDFIALAKKIQETIIKMPMKYIGYSISQRHYSIFEYQTGDRRLIPNEIDSAFLIQRYGTFSIPVEYYDAFRLFGSFINGQDSILFKWAEFSVSASRQNLSIEKVVHEVLKSPITARDIAASKQIFKSILKKEGKVFCVWTGKAISSYDVDHVIPFSIWKNNDLWNLLPSEAQTNKLKRDKIPSFELIERRKDLIFHYWGLLNEHQPHRFQKEIRITLLGNQPTAAWQESSFKQLQTNCQYLISNRGFLEWRL